MLLGTTPRLLVVMFGVMLTLFVATGFYTKAYKAEKRERAQQQHEAGEALAAAGRFEDAAEMYAEAMVLGRGTPQYLVYQQALALALVNAGRPNEAETYLQELTTEDPANGIANLTLARIYVDRGNDDAAMQHYHRAIYGLWPEDPRANRIRVRFELVSLFEKTNRYTEMEAELLRLLPEAPDDPETRKRIANLFMTAHSYDNAAELFGEIVVENPRDAEALAGLGDAEFERAHYLSAASAYRRAIRYRPEDLQSRTQLDIAEEIYQLDPTVRGLGSYTRLQRSRELVKRARAGLDFCLPEDVESLPEETRELLDRAQVVIDGKIRQPRTMESVEENIALAEALLSFRRENCGSAPVPDRALELTLRKLAS